MPRIESQKANKSQKTPKKVICSKTKCWTIWVQDCQSSSPSMSWKLNTSLTQKDTVDRGAWIKKIQKEGMQEDSERTKSPKAQKCEMAWEWGTNEYCLPCVTILWCPSWELPKDKGKKWNSYSWSQKSYLDFEMLVPIFPKLEYHQWLKYIHLPFGKSRHIEKFKVLVFIAKNSLLIKEEIVRDLCSPGSRQLLQVQPFSQIFQILNPPFDFIWPGIVGLLKFVIPLL